MQDLFQNYVRDLNKLREAFHNELSATAEELSKAMDAYARPADRRLPEDRETDRASPRPTLRAPCHEPKLFP